MSAIFFPALSLLLSANVEGRWNPNLDGGTYAGVARTKHPEWTGWAKVDIARQSGVDLGSDQVFQSLQEDLVQFYNQEFWLPAKAGMFESQALANFFFACCVNMGQHEAVKLLQRACGLMLVDGLIGPQTIQAANSLPGSLATYCDMAERFYEELAVTSPQDVRFEAGWHNRVESYRVA